MRVMEYPGLEYIPEWNKNKKELAESQIKIPYKYLSGPEREKIFGFEPIQFDPNGKQTTGFTFRIDNENLVKMSIVNVINLTVGEESITTAEGICIKPELAGLYRELVDFFMGINRPVDKKKFK